MPRAAQVIVSKVFATSSRRSALAGPATQCPGFMPAALDMDDAALQGRWAAAGSLPIDSAVLVCHRSVNDWDWIHVSAIPGVFTHKHGIGGGRACNRAGLDHHRV